MTNKEPRIDLELAYPTNLGQPGTALLRPVTDRAERWLESNVIPGTWMQSAGGTVIAKEDIERVRAMAKEDRLELVDRGNPQAN